MLLVVDSSGKAAAEAGVDHGDFVRMLRQLEVPDALIYEAWTIVEGPALGVLLYGSWARRDAGALSDLDLLLLSNIRSRKRTSDKVSVTVYTSAQLRDAHRTLYGMHLVRDG